MTAAAMPGTAGPDSATLLLETADEEHRVRGGAEGAEIEVWRRVATIAVPAPSLATLAAASAAETAQLVLPLDVAWVDDDTLPLFSSSGSGR